jgi:hypothetical protein
MGISMYNLSTQHRNTPINTGIAPKTSHTARNIFIFLYFLIPIFSVESIFAWYIFGSASYKTIKLYKSHKENKTRKALIILTASTTLAIAFNILVYYSSKIIVMKTV